MTDLDVSHSKAGPARFPNLTALPLVGISGTRGKSTVLWLLESMLRTSGCSVGAWASSGVYLDGARQEGELGPWGRVLDATRTRQIDVALQELESALVTGVGLPEKIYPLAAITTLCGNNEECLISPEASQNAQAQSIVARAVRADGLLVLNADDHAVLEAADATEAAIILFALHPENPALRRHLTDGGRGVWLEDAHVVIGDALDQRAVVDVANAGFTLDGSLTFQVQNLLCAVALAAAMNLPDLAIREAVTEFHPDPSVLSGSCNIIRRADATIVVDHARQVWTLRSLIRGIRHQPHRRTITVAGAFSHLSLAHTVEAGRLLGRLGGVVLLHASDIDRPNLDPLMDGIAQNEIPPLVLTLPSEQEALEQALRMLAEDTLCLVITGDADEILESITRNGQTNRG